MATVEVRDASGSVVEQRTLPPEFFDARVNVAVMHQVVTAGLAARRAGTHSTKTRAEVSGGGAKPWRQKGTGRARHGSIRSPIWSGGGIAHGPKPRDYSMRVNKKMKRAALRSALTDATRTGKLALIDSLVLDEPRTRDAAGVLAALGLDGRVLVVIGGPDDATEKSFRNLARVKVSYPGNLSTFDVLYADRILFTVEALDALRGTEVLARVESPDEPGEDGAETEEEPGTDAGEADREAEVEPERNPATVEEEGL